MKTRENRIAWRCVVQLLVLGVWAAGAQGQARNEFDLSYRWQEGASTSYRVAEEMEQAVSGGGGETLLAWRREFELTERVVSVDAERGESVVERSIGDVSVAVKQGDAEVVEYRSDDPTTAEAGANPLIAPFAGLAGQTIRFTIDDDGRVLGVEGAVEAWASAMGGFGGVGGLGNAVPMEEQLRAQIEAGVNWGPGEPIRIRKPWEHRVDHATPIGTVSSVLTHQIRNFVRSRSEGDGRVARVAAEGELVLSDEGGLAGSLIEGLGVKLESSSIVGESLFDVTNGRLVRQEMTIRMEWGTEVSGDSGLAELMELVGSGTQTMTQRAVIERIDE